MRLTSILFIATLALSAIPAHALMPVNSPTRSPSLGENDGSTLTDEHGDKSHVVCVFLPGPSGAAGIPTAQFIDGKRSQVTGRKEPSLYAIVGPSGSTIRCEILHLVGVNTSTNQAVPFVLPQSAIPTNPDFGNPGYGIVSLANGPTGGSVGTAASTVDLALVLNVDQTTASQAYTLPTPTDNTHARKVYVVNTGSAAFSLLSQTVGPSGTSGPSGAVRGAVWNGSAWLAN